MDKLLYISFSQTTFIWGDPMAYQWDSSLETGYEKIDKQHKQLFAAVNNLMEASGSGKGDAAVMETLDFLTGYAIKHFSDEEQLQLDYDYPDT
jgi:hemerythrin